MMKHEASKANNESTGSPGVLSSASSGAENEMPVGPPGGGVRAWLQIVGAFFMYFNTWGIVSSYGSYQSHYEDTLLRDSSSFQVSTIGSVQSFLMVFLGFVAGPVFDRGHFVLLLRSGSALVVLGTVAQALSARYWQLLLAQGVCVGVGMGLLAVPSVAVPALCFSGGKAAARRLPLATGIVVSASGFGGIVYPVMIRCLIPLVGFQYTSLAVALVILTTLGIANVVVLLAPQPQRTTTTRTFLDRSALADAPYLLVVLGLVLAFLGLYTPFFHVGAYARAAGILTAVTPSDLVTILNAASIPGRILVAPALQLLPLGPLAMLAAAVACLAALALCLLLLDSTATAVLLLVLYGFCTGAFFTLQPAVFAGHGTRMGMAATATSFGLLVGAPAAGALMRAYGAGAAWVWSGSCLAAGALVMAAGRLVLAGGGRRRLGAVV